MIDRVPDELWMEVHDIVQVKISYTESYVDQMLRYGQDYSPLTK